MDLYTKYIIATLKGHNNAMNRILVKTTLFALSNGKKNLNFD